MAWCGIRSNHHVNVPIIEKYRLVQWVFAIYEGIEMRRAYQMDASQLEPYFSDWEAKWLGNEKDINNPKIPLNFVMEQGTLVYSDQKGLDLQNAAAIRRAKTRASADRRAAKKKAQGDLLESLEEGNTTGGE